MKKTLLFCVALCAFMVGRAQDELTPHTYVPQGAEKHVYKTAGSEQLAVWAVYPAKPVREGRNPAMVFFFGGGWSSGMTKQFETHAEYLAQRGMTAFLVEYRTRKSSGTTPFESVSDARSAMRFIRANAAELGIDPSRIAASGGSAGGHLAAAAAYVTSFDEQGEDRSVNPAPDALVLFNPVIDNSAQGYGNERLGERWREFSPMHNITAANARPTLFMVGSEDHLIPVATAEGYARLCREAGGRCDLEIYPGATHGFFNIDRKKKQEERYYETTIARMDDFLVSLGYLPAKK
jgi:acetyl esterase/lipase